MNFHISLNPFRGLLSIICSCKHHPYQKITLQSIFLALTTVPFLVACEEPAQISSSQPSSESLEIWWDKGFTLEEDEALRSVVESWEQQSGKSIRLSFYTTDELPIKVQRAIRANSPPDLMMSHGAERVLNPHLAWEGKLADVSRVIEPIEHLYPEAVLKTVDYYNKAENQRSYYAVPIHQATVHIFYWRDLLRQAGQSENDIPRDWQGFWQFWQQVQESLRTQYEDIYGLGLPMSAEAGDTYQIFEQILEAFDVSILDTEGNLLVDAPQVRQGIIKSLAWYAQYYQQGNVPPNAVDWLNPDNNRNLLNRAVVMTPNFSLSIPAAIRQDPEVYYQQLGTIEFPNKPSGEPMTHLVIVRQAVVFASQNQELAKDFLAYLIQPEVMADYLKASGGRSLPVLKPIWQDSFWTNPEDPHFSTATKSLIDGSTRSFYTAQNPAYSLVLQENVWGKALESIVLDEVTPEQAADEAIARIEEIFAQWQ